MFHGQANSKQSYKCVSINSSFLCLFSVKHFASNLINQLIISANDYLAN